MFNRISSIPHIDVIISIALAPVLTVVALVFVAAIIRFQ